MTSKVTDAYALLGITVGASAEQVRQAYLQLVKQFPPDQEPEKFRAIHSAYQMLGDPLIQAEAILNQAATPPNLMQVIESAAKTKPRLPKLVLLALGNQN